MQLHANRGNRITEFINKPNAPKCKQLVRGLTNGKLQIEFLIKAVQAKTVLGSFKKVSDEDLSKVNIELGNFHGECNYLIAPHTT